MESDNFQIKYIRIWGNETGRIVQMTTVDKRPANPPDYYLSNSISPISGDPIHRRTRRNM